MEIAGKFWIYNEKPLKSFRLSVKKYGINEGKKTVRFEEIEEEQSNFIHMITGQVSSVCSAAIKIRYSVQFVHTCPHKIPFNWTR